MRARHSPGSVPVCVREALRRDDPVRRDDGLYDVTGTERQPIDSVPTQAVEGVLESLRGSHLQMPPAFSAKKVAGQRAHAMARRAEPVALQPAPVRLMTTSC